jgi:hypothetical protein
MKVSRCDRPTNFRQSVCFHRCKAQTSSMASQKLIKEDHFLRAPRECLRYLDETNRSSPHRDLSEPLQYTRAFELTSSRHPTIHFSKNKTVSRRNVAYNFRCPRRVFPGGWVPIGEANLIVVSMAVNGELRIFSELSKTRGNARILLNRQKLSAQC